MADYAENGWIVVEGVFDQARMDAVASLASECCRREAAGEELRLNGLPAQPVDPELTHKIKASLSDRGLNGQLLPRKLDAPITKDRRFGAVAADPELRMLAVRPKTALNLDRLLPCLSPFYPPHSRRVVAQQCTTAIICTWPC